MKKIAFLFPNEYLSDHLYRCSFLTENGDDVWGDTQFILNPQEGVFDAVVVSQSTLPLEKSYNLFCPPTKTLLVLKEPPDILFLPEAYTQQFYCTLGQDPRVESKIKILSQSGHGWFAELSLKQLRAMDYPKNGLISAIISNKEDTQGHRQRLLFMQQLKEHFGEQLDWFGRGSKELGQNKLDGLLTYKYHIVIENGSWEHYWTEKLSDAFIANCFPFYWGDPKIDEYFSTKSLKKIDIYDIEGSINIIEKAITHDLYSESQEFINDSRVKILSKYHPYQTILDVLSQLPDSLSSRITIIPHNQFRYKYVTRWKLRIQHYSNFFKNLLS